MKQTLSTDLHSAWVCRERDPCTIPIIHGAPQQEVSSKRPLFLWLFGGISNEFSKENLLLINIHLSPLRVLYTELDLHMFSGDFRYTGVIPALP